MASRSEELAGARGGARQPAGRPANPEDQYQALENYGRDLTERPATASSTRSSAATRRSAGSCRCSPRRTKNNPVLIGEPGVGKTAIVEGWPSASSNGDVPEALKDKRLVALDLGASLVAGPSTAASSRTG